MQRSIFPQFKIDELEQFPVPKNNKDNDKLLKKLSQLSDKRIDNNNSNAIDDEIDSLTYELFKIEKKNILSVENFLKNIDEK